MAVMMVVLITVVMVWWLWRFLVCKKTNVTGINTLPWSILSYQCVISECRVQKAG